MWWASSCGLGEAMSSTPLGRNHMLLATWTLAYWALLLATRWLQGEAVWEGSMRWIMAGLALLGSALLGITGTLGGHLVGVYTEVSEFLRLLGWEVYTTFYVPNVTLAVILIAAIILTAIGILGHRPPREVGSEAKVPNLGAQATGLIGNPFWCCAGMRARRLSASRSSP